MSPTSSYARMRPVSRQDPCPVCGKSDWCLLAPDGSAAICPRVEAGAVKRAGDAGWLHILDSGTREHRPFAPLPNAAPSRPYRDWSGYLSATQRDANTARNDLARQLSVSGAALERLEVGFDAARRCWIFPERDALGTVIGISRRDTNGVKKRLWGSRAGLCYPKNWDRIPGPVLLVEGATDTAALLTLGLCAVGRPSNTGGVDHLIGLLEYLSLEREIIVVGERDEKSDGRWPGRDGAISTAHQLSAGLERPIAWALPPDHAKDSRAWLQAAPRGLPKDRLADLFVTGLSRTSVAPIPTYAVPSTAGPVVSLPDWRASMRAARSASLAHPGCYLDGSPTGSGKTNVDLQVLVQTLNGEAR